jgi:hypothetical protein
LVQSTHALPDVPQLLLFAFEGEVTHLPVLSQQPVLQFAAPQVFAELPQEGATAKMKPSTVPSASAL